MNNNLDKWRFYQKDVCSPNSFIDWSFIFLVGAALQRRVWLGSFERGLFPNPFIVLVGKAGLGKGQCIGPINELLKHHTLPLLPNQDPTKDRRLLFNVGASSTTFEALTRELATAVSKFNYIRTNKNGQPETATYIHSSLAFSLEELSSLFNKDSEKISDFMREAYDCKDYERKTKTQGCDVIRRICVSMLAGTTPGNMFDIFSSKILNDGFASRLICVYEHSNKVTTLIQPPLTSEQLKVKEELLEYLLHLSHCYGQYSYSEEAEKFFEDWWKEAQLPGSRVNKNSRLESYYARKKIHVQKLSLILHHLDCSGDNHPKVIEKSSCELAIKLLNDVEKRMHFAFVAGGRNPLNKSQKEVLAFIQAFGKQLTFVQIWENFLEDLREVELQECLHALAAVGHINVVTQGREVFYAYCKKD